MAGIICKSLNVGGGGASHDILADDEFGDDFPDDETEDGEGRRPKVWLVPSRYRGFSVDIGGSCAHYRGVRYP